MFIRDSFWEKSSGMSDLGTLGSDYSFARAINDYGQVVGSSTTADEQSRAFLWEKSSGMSDLGTLGGNDSDATAINNLGQVIGYYTADWQSRPFFWDKTSGMSDLNDLISDLGWTVNGVVGINNAGQIVGYGSYNGQGRAFLLTPNISKSVPEPSSALAFLALGGVGAGSLAKRQRLQQDASSCN
jgi:probable HAF family extracellular repeat protein